MDEASQDQYETLITALKSKGVNLEAVEAALREQSVETSSWGYSTSGTRFATFPALGVPRNPFERIDDAAQVHHHTGICGSVAIHIPWDKVEKYSELRAHSEGLGMRIGAVNPNLFQEPEYMLGSITNPDPSVRKLATEQLLACVQIAHEVGSEALSIWLADGTNYPGQGSFLNRRHWMLESLEEVYGAMPQNMRLLLEYKPYEPGFYHTDLPDWGAALLTCQKLGERAQVLVDLGHHPPGANIEHIVALLLDEKRLGGLHFNDRKYGDDDLITGSINPLQLFLIYTQLVMAGDEAKRVAYMIDESHNIEPKIEAMIQSVMNLQEAYAKALIVDWDALASAQHQGDVLRGHRILLDAYSTDIRPLCAKVRSDLGASANPIRSFRDSRYMDHVAIARSSGQQVVWG